MAQLGAIQVGGNALKDQKEAVRQYRHALSLGGNATLPKLFEAAGPKFEFGENMLESVSYTPWTLRMNHCVYFPLSS